MIWTGKRIAAGSPFHWRYKDQLIELCERHGEMKHDVMWIEYDIVDMPLLRFGVARHDESGHKHVQCEEPHEPFAHDASCKLDMDIVEHALIGDLPDWWRPA